MNSFIYLGISGCFCLRPLVASGMFPTNVFYNIGHCPWANWLWLTAHYVKRCISVNVINGNGATSD